MTSTIDLGNNVINEYLEDLRRRGCTDDTITVRRRVLRRLNSDLPGGVGQVTDEELAEWLYRDGWSQNTIATYYCTVTQFYGWAADPRDPWINLDPTVGLPRPPKPRGIARATTDDQLRLILTRSIEPYRLWSTIAAYQGLRCIEISRLDREHITEQTLYVMRGKGNRPRMHDTDPYVWAAVKDLPPGPVATLHGRRATARQISANTSRYFDRQLGLPEVTLHRLRHWLGVTVQRRYRNIRVTQAVLGHVSVASTQIYTDATDEEQRAARAMLPRLAG